jgi:glycosyltransferase involved in cell wall biosynthesis
MNDSSFKHVWVLNHYAQEPGQAGGTRHFSIARSLPKYGWTAAIIAASVELNTGRQRISSGTSKQLDDIQGTPFLWVWTPTYKGNGIGRFWNMLVYSFRVLIPSVTRDLRRPDLIIGSSVHPFAAWSAAILAKRFGVPFVFEVRDLWPQTLVDLGRLGAKSPVTWLLRRLEVWLYRKASRIAVLLPGAAEYIVPLGIAPNKICWIPNGVDLENGLNPSKLQDSEQFTFMYFGAHGTANGLANLLRALREIEKDPDAKNIRLRLIGDGPQKRSLQELASSLQLSTVSFEDPVPKECIPKLADQASAFVFTLLDVPVFKYGISSNKLFDFMAAARPVVFSCEASNNPVADAGAGMTVPPGDVEALASAMIELSKMPLEARVAMGQAGREYVRINHDYRNLAERVADMLNDAVVCG